MSLSRPQLRAAVRAAIAAEGRFATFSRAQNWGRKRDGTMLPAVDVYTPRFQVERAAAGMRREVTDLLVLVRRQDGDTLEDLLDADAAALESVVLTALDPLIDDIELVSGDNDVPGVGEKRVGTMMLTFRAVALTDRPL